MKLDFTLRTVIYCTILLILGAYYDGWSSTTQYFINENVYVDECTPEEQARVVKDGQFKCEAQGYRIGHLLAYYRVSEFLSSVLWGVFMDKFGPKYTVIFGTTLRILSWMLMIIHNSFSGIMILCAILGGLACNGVVFPMYTLAQYNERMYYTSMCWISFSTSISTFYMFIFNKLKESLPNISMIALVYVKLLLTHVPMLILGAFVVPRDLAADLKLNWVKKHQEIVSNDDKTVIELEQGNDTPLSHADSNHTGVPEDLIKNSELNTVNLEGGSKGGSGKYGDAFDPVQDSSGEKAPWTLRNFLGLCLRYDVIILKSAAIVNFVSFTFAQEAFAIAFAGDSTAVMVNSILLPLSFVLSLLFMIILEYIDIVIVIAAINAMSILVHLNVFGTHFSLSIIISITMCIGYSLLLTQYYIYLDKEIPVTYSGSVKGYFTTAVGITILLNLLINHLVEIYNCQRTIHVVLVTLRILVLVPIIYLIHDRRSIKVKGVNKDHVI